MVLNFNISLSSPISPQAVTRWRRIRSKNPLLFLVFNSLIIYNCGIDIEDSIPPSPPKWVEKSVDTEWPERGIDAHESKGIYLEWEINPNEDVIACDIYRASLLIGSDSLSTFEFLARIEGDTETSLMEYVDRAVMRGGEYIYKLRAQDNAENISDFSNAVKYGRLRAISIELMHPNGVNVSLPGDRSLSWSYPYSIEMESYCITILTQANHFISRAVFMPQNYTGESESWRIPTDVILSVGEQYQWRIDVGANYIDGKETLGSESTWAPFVYLPE